ncbi:prolyl oligopeptidase family serine peptidase [Maribacter hydrothermalis]|uniref:Glucan-binding protein n=1 Tax=Maribacter hydrothermalis TaxID=1836467 RepID=A0A1B7Z8H3_9FLAO|nr:prolyl oligopeptidase family serine peptidase [Maribacter hydrothermalis]APQ18994.1 glucan-binding protein [Maribacter hydrothermalis]OBR38993.1 glucan-binding protein [Maribacter hydrothermalis]
MKKSILSLSVFLILMILNPLFAVDPEIKTISNYADDNYTLILEGYDWGPAVKKVVLQTAELTTEANATDYKIEVERSADGVVMKPEEAKGSREILFAYVSDANGNRVSEGNHITLVLLVHPNNPLDSPIKYVFKDGRGSNQWIDYKMTITQVSTTTIWNKEVSRLYTDLDRFNLKGKHSNNGITLTYASFEPKTTAVKSPLIIWLHGGGEGGSDPSIALVANKATNYASPEIQSFFNGAYVLVPQAPTFWMQNANGDYTRGDTDDIYNKALFNLIDNFVKDNPKVDSDRVYIGGCSNGGYMSLKLILEHPNYFAAGYISALAYQNQYITDEQVKRINNVPIWFVHSRDDTTTIPDETVVPLYNRLINAKAPNVHFSYYDHVIDLTGFYGGENYYFPGHWSWIYSHANNANFDFDNKPVLLNGENVTIMKWLAAQKK